MPCSVFENDETVSSWKMGSSVVYWQPCFREVMEESEEADAGNDCKEAREDQVPEKQEERSSTTKKIYERR